MTARLAARFYAPALLVSPRKQDRDKGAGAVEYIACVLIALAIVTAVFPPLREFVVNMVHGLQMPTFG